MTNHAPAPAEAATEVGADQDAENPWVWSAGVVLVLVALLAFVLVVARLAGAL